MDGPNPIILLTRLVGRVARRPYRGDRRIVTGERPAGPKLRRQFRSWQRPSTHFRIETVTLLIALAIAVLCAWTLVSLVF